MKFSCLEEVAGDVNTTLSNLEEAWGVLPNAQVQELVQFGKSRMNKFQSGEHFSPLHEASQTGNKIAVEFFCVRN